MLKTWSMAMVGRGKRKRLKVKAHTKGEARAVLKRELGIPSKGRLPIGVEVLESR